MADSGQSFSKKNSLILPQHRKCRHKYVCLYSAPQYLASLLKWKVKWSSDMWFQVQQQVNKHTWAKLIHEEIKQFSQRQKRLCKNTSECTTRLFPITIPSCPFLNFWFKVGADADSLLVYCLTCCNKTRSENVYFSGNSSYAVVSMIWYTHRSETKNNDPNRSNTQRHPSPYGWWVYLCWTSIRIGNFGAAVSDLTVIIQMWGWGLT